MLTSKLPFAGATHIQVFRKIINGLEGVPEEIMLRIRSPAAKDLIVKMLAGEPGKRLDVKEVLDHPWCRHEPFSISPRGTDYLTNDLQALVVKRKLRAVGIGAVRPKSTISSQLNSFMTAFDRIEIFGFVFGFHDSRSDRVGC